MPGPNTRSRRFWLADEDRNLIIGYNRYYDSRNVYVDIQRDPTLGFTRSRSNIDIKDRLRVLYTRIVPIKSFFVFFGCDDPKEYIPEEHWDIFDNENPEETLMLLPERHREDLSFILYKYSTVINSFKEAFESLPENLPEEPIITERTWSQICDKNFIGRNRLSESKKEELLAELILNGYMRRRIVGIRTFVYRF
jgi:hypothetical protein